MVPHSFKTELKPVFRKGFSTVYRMRIPDEIAECKDVQKTKCIRLKLLKPSLEGRALPQEDFAVKISKKTILVPMAISLIIWLRERVRMRHLPLFLLEGGDCCHGLLPAPACLAGAFDAFFSGMFTLISQYIPLD